MYANWIQETSKECKKELQKYKVTNLVNGQRSRQFGMAGHVMRKTDGRWSNALLKWDEGKMQGHNTTTLYWEHDIEVWIKRRFPDDHSTWQQLARNAEQWTKLRNEYAEDWPNNHLRPDTCQKKDQKNNATTQSDQTQVQNGQVQNGHSRHNTGAQAANKEPDKSKTIASTQLAEGDRTDKQKGVHQTRSISTLAKQRRITILLKSSSSSHEEQAKGKKYCCD